MGDLKPDPRNPRTHSKKQARQIADSIETSGYFNPILIDDDDVLICGHGRLRAAQLLARETVPVIRICGLSLSAKRALRIADNKIALNATAQSPSGLAPALRGSARAINCSNVSITRLSCIGSVLMSEDALACDVEACSVIARSSHSATRYISFDKAADWASPGGIH